MAELRAWSLPYAGPRPVLLLDSFGSDTASLGSDDSDDTMVPESSPDGLPASCTLLGRGVPTWMENRRGEAGAGTQGSVYEVMDDTNEYALKTTKHALLKEHETEVGILRALSKHEGYDRHVIRFYDATICEGVGYTLLALARGTWKTFQKVKDDPVQINEAIRKGFRVLQTALQWLHAKGVMHRDIKPANILIVGDEERTGVHPVISDFGLAIQVEDPSKKLFEQVGTWLYLSPAAVGGDGYGMERDRWALGLMMLQAVFCGDYDRLPGVKGKVEERRIECTPMLSRFHLPMWFATLPTLLEQDFPEDAIKMELLQAAAGLCGIRVSRKREEAEGEKEEGEDANPANPAKRLKI